MKTSQTRQRLQITLSSDAIERLVTAAEATGLSKSAVLEVLIRQAYPRLQTDDAHEHDSPGDIHEGR